jgi:zinc transporter ZupT
LDPTLIVLIYASLAAAAAVIGVVPVWALKRLPPVWMGWSNALAAGLMLGAAYALLGTGIRDPSVGAVVGAVAGIVFVHWTHVLHGTGDLDLNRLEDTDPVYGYQVLLVNALHSAAEGVAIGAAMVVSLPFGAFVALAIAVHNVPEATVLVAVLTSRGVRLWEAAGITVVANVGQILLAVVVYAVAVAAPAVLPWALGFAVGALFHLVMLELLPESYRASGATGIAVVTLVAMGIVVLLGSTGG